MKRLVRVILILGVLGGIVAAGYNPAVAYWTKRNAPHWRTLKVARGEIVAVVNATGTIKPVLSVRVGSFVSGPIAELRVDFNQEVVQGQLLAKIDPRIYAAAVARDKAALASRHADVSRITASLQLAKNNEKRARDLRAENADYVSQQELDQVSFTRMQLEAELELAQASVQQAEAQLATSQAQLDYTEITAPVAGVVIDRKIDPGQTLAAQFQTPELFVLAPNMREKMHIYASVDEADIGLIRTAQQQNRPVHFTVDAYPDELFEGTVEEIRFSATEVQNVVTYPVVVAAPNPNLRLLPGMTAGISFEVDRRPNTLKIPNAALRFYPEEKYVGEADRELLAGLDWEKSTEEQSTERSMSADEKAEARRQRSRRHVWVQAGNFLRAVEVTVGLSDSRFTEMVAGNLRENDELVIGLEPKKSWGG